MASTTAQISPDLARHLRNALDGRWHMVKNRSREQLSGEVFRPHYTPNTVIARTKALEQLKIIAAAGAAEDGFRKEHGGTGDVGAAVTTIEMLAMSDLSLMVKPVCSGASSAARSRTSAPNATTRRTCARSSTSNCWAASR